MPPAAIGGSCVSAHPVPVPCLPVRRDADLRSRVGIPLVSKPQAESFAVQCNIDAKGRTLRLVSGTILAAIGIVFVGLSMVRDHAATWPWILGIALLAVGVFQIYEGWAGWCIVRAMGFKTRI